MSIEGTPEYAFGDESEQIVADALHKAGFHLIHLRKAKGGGGITAPVLDHPGPGRKARLPDFDVSGYGWVFYVEVKGKSRPGKYDKWGCHTHFVSWRLWKDYLKVQEERSAAVLLVVREADVGVLLCQWLDVIWKDKDAWHYGPMIVRGAKEDDGIYFRRSCLQPLEEFLEGLRTAPPPPGWSPTDVEEDDAAEADDEPVGATALQPSLFGAMNL